MPLTLLHRGWKWQHSWYAFSILGIAVVPTVIAIATVPRLFSIYESIPESTLLAMVLCGAGGVFRKFW